VFLLLYAMLVTGEGAYNNNSYLLGLFIFQTNAVLSILSGIY